jgi:hypothetical protein
LDRPRTLGRGRFPDRQIARGHRDRNGAAAERRAGDDALFTLDEMDDAEERHGSRVRPRREGRRNGIRPGRQDLAHDGHVRRTGCGNGSVRHGLQPLGALQRRLGLGKTAHGQLLFLVVGMPVSVRAELGVVHAAKQRDGLIAIAAAQGGPSGDISPNTSVGLPWPNYYAANDCISPDFSPIPLSFDRGFPLVQARLRTWRRVFHYCFMSLELIVVSVSRWAEGRSIIGFGEARPGEGGFIRLVAPTPAGTLRPEQYALRGGAEPRVGDRLRVEAPWRDSRPGQPENMVVGDTPWGLLERPAGRGLVGVLERRRADAGLLFGGPGRAERADYPADAPSILWVEPAGARAASVWDGERGRYRARLRFAAGGAEYDLPLTDWHYSRRLCAMGEGEYSLERIGCRAPHGLRLVVTLGEAFHGWRYKMVAGLHPLRTVTLWRDAGSPRLSLPIRNVVDCPLEPAGPGTGRA